MGVEETTDCEPYIIQALKHISTTQTLSPMLVVNILAKNKRYGDNNGRGGGRRGGQELNPFLFRFLLFAFPSLFFPFLFVEHTELH